MAGNNPYNPQTNYAEWQAWEQEQARKDKKSFEESTEGQQKIKEAADAREAKKKTDNYGGRGTTPAVGGENREQAKARFTAEARKKYGEDPSMWKDYVENQMAQWDKKNKTHMTVSEKKQDEQNTADVVNQQTQEHWEAMTGGQNVDTDSAIKNAKSSVEKLGGFDMPQGNVNDLSTYEKIGDKAAADGVFPKSIWQAWKKGEFGDPEGKDAKQVRNNLILNSAMTAIGNAARGFQAGLNHGTAEHKDSMWKKRQEANMERQTERENQQLDVLKQAETDNQLADMWESFTPAQKQGILDAKNAYGAGQLGKAEDLMRNSMGSERYAQWLQYFENLKAQLSVNADARAQEQLRYMEMMGPLGALMGLAGKFI